MYKSTVHCAYHTVSKDCVYYTIFLGNQKLSFFLGEGQLGLFSWWGEGQLGQHDCEYAHVCTWGGIFFWGDDGVPYQQRVSKQVIYYHHITIFPVVTTWSIFLLLLLEDNLFPYLLNEDFRMLHVVTTGAYYPPVVTTWKILTTGASQLTAGPLCSGVPCLEPQKSVREKGQAWGCGSLQQNV